MERTWTTVGEESVERVGGRKAIEAKILELGWQTVGDSLTLGFTPGEAIKATIGELGIPKVTAIAVDGFNVYPANAEEEGFHPGFYGIEGNYKNGRTHVFVLDTGTELHPVCSDFPVEVDGREPDGQRIGDGGRVVATNG